MHIDYMSNGCFIRGMTFTFAPGFTCGYIGVRVTHIFSFQCRNVVWVVFVLRFVYRMLPVSLDYPLLPLGFL